jgi:hypothetical protein
MPWREGAGAVPLEGHRGQLIGISIGPDFGADVSMQTLNQGLVCLQPKVTIVNHQETK